MTDPTVFLTEVRADWAPDDDWDLADAASRQVHALYTAVGAVLELHKPAWDGTRYICAADGEPLTDAHPNCATYTPVTDKLRGEE